MPSGAIWRGQITVLVGAGTISSGEVLAALRRHAGATVLGERTWGKDYVLRVEAIDPDWRALIPDGQIEVPGEVLAGGLLPDGPIPAELAARVGRTEGPRPEGRGPFAGVRRRSVDRDRGADRARRARDRHRAVDVGEHVHAVVGELLERHVLLIDDAVAGLQELVDAERATGSSGRAGSVAAQVSPPVTPALTSSATQRATSMQIPGWPSLNVAGSSQWLSQP